MDAVSMRDTLSLHFRDALLAATMKQHTIGTIYTEDSHFNKIPWISDIDPFTRRIS
jgi:predicted nucleic acid-binding protein